MNPEPTIAGSSATRVLVPRPVAEALMPRDCPHVDCEGVGDTHCWGCHGSGVLSPTLNLLVVEGEPECSLGHECDDTTHDGRCGGPRPDPELVRAIEAGERIGLDVECQTSVHLRPGRECIDNPDCTDGRVRVGSVLPTKVMPVRLDMYFRDDPGAVVVLSKAMTNAGEVRYAASPGAVSTDITDAMSVYGPAESLVGKFAVEVEDARREP